MTIMMMTMMMQQQGDYDDNADKRIEWIVNKNYEN